MPADQFTDLTKLRVDRPARHVLRVLINRPEKRNAIDHDVREQLIQALTLLSSDEATRAVILGGHGGHFSAGGDLPSMVGLSEPQARARMRHIARVCSLLSGTTIPVVTAMEGVSAGACIGIALLGDLIIAGEGSRILFPFMRLALVPDWGMLLTLPRRVGLPAARRLLVRMDALTGEEALRIGLVDEVAPDAKVMELAVQRAAELACLPRLAFSRMKHRLSHPSGNLEEELRREEDDQAFLLGSEDFAEGYAAFGEKRQAEFIRGKREGA